MSFENKTILITGGAGFIGSHLIDELALKSPEKIVVVDNFFLGNIENLNNAKKAFPDLNLEVYREDAADYTAMDSIFTRENIDIVYNLASKSLPYSFIHPEGAFSVNVNIANTLAGLLRRDKFNKLIHFSSSEVYGSAEYIPMDINHPINPTTPYAAGKAAADLLLLSNFLTFGINVSILRPFNNFGPRQNETVYSALIPLTIKRILKNQNPIIEGTGEQTRDFLYVSDTVDAAIRIAESNNVRGQIIQIANGKEISVFEVIDAITKEMNYLGSIEYKPARPADVQRHCGSNALAKEIIDFSPKVSFTEGIKRTVEYYKSIELKDMR